MPIKTSQIIKEKQKNIDINKNTVHYMDYYWLHDSQVKSQINKLRFLSGVCVASLC